MTLPSDQYFRCLDWSWFVLPDPLQTEGENRALTDEKASCNLAIRVAMEVPTLSTINWRGWKVRLGSNHQMEAFWLVPVEPRPTGSERHLLFSTA